jgi:hypothetical protein
MTTRPLVKEVTVFDPRRTPTNVANNVANNVDNDKKLRPNVRVLWALIMMFIGVAFGVIGKMIIHEDMVTAVGVLLSVAGMFMLAYSSLSPSRPGNYNSIPGSKPEVLTQTQTQTPKSLSSGSNADYVPSITERTTDLLKNPAATTQSQKHEE